MATSSWRRGGVAVASSLNHIVVVTSLRSSRCRRRGVVVAEYGRVLMVSLSWRRRRGRRGRGRQFVLLLFV